MTRGATERHGVPRPHEEVPLHRPFIALRVVCRIGHVTRGRAFNRGRRLRNGIAVSNRGAVLLSSAASVPSLPVEVQGTLLVPITSQGGYALTGEVRGLSGGGFGGAYVGAGVGFGTLSASRQTGPVLTVFVGKPIAPYTTIELRAYQSTRDDGTTAGFLGLRFTF